MSSNLFRQSNHAVVALWVVAAVAFAVRLAAALGLDGLARPEVDEFDVIARNLLAGRGYSYPHLNVVYYSYATPLPAWISAGSYWMAASLVPAMLLQIAAGTALAVLTALVAGRMFGGWIAPLTAGVLTALHPGLVVYSSTKFHPLAFDSLFFLIALWQSFRLAERVTIGRAVALGLFIGLGALSRTTILVFLPIVGAWLWWVTPLPGRKSALKCALVAAVCAAAVIAPWTIRNTLLHQRFVLMMSTDSFVFWLGNNPRATGSAHTDTGQPIISTLSPEERSDLERQPGEMAQADWFRSRAHAFIRAEPGRFVELALKKFGMFWWFSDQTGLLYPRAWLRLYQAYYVAALLLAAVAMFQLTRSGDSSALDRVVLIALLALAVSVVQSLHYVEGRHRWGIEPMILALSGGGMAAVVNRYRQYTFVGGIPRS